MSGRQAEFILRRFFRRIQSRTASFSLLSFHHLVLSVFSSKPNINNSSVPEVSLALVRGCQESLRLHGLAVCRLPVLPSYNQDSGTRCVGRLELWIKKSILKI